MRYVLSFVVLSLALGLQIARADDKAKEKDPIDPKVVEIVKQAAAVFKNAKSMHVDAALSTTIDGESQKREIKGTATYDIERPNRLALRTKLTDKDNVGLELVADGKQLSVLRHGLKQYTAGEGPSSLAEVGQEILRLRTPNTGMLFQNVLMDDPHEALMDGVNSCSYAGIDKVGDTEAHHLKFTQDQFNWEMWIAKDGKPYVLKMTNTREGENGKVVSVETYSNWKIDAPISKDAFTFTAPKDAKKVDQFEEG